MRERNAAIILLILMGLGSIMASILAASPLPLLACLGAAYAAYTLGRSKAPRKRAEDEQQSYSDRNYERYLEWRAGRD